jgi:hypothetical protein
MNDLNRLHWRIAYSLDVYYYVIATSNVPDNEYVHPIAIMAGGYNVKNGMASIFQQSPSAPRIISRHLFVPEGNAEVAMQKMILQLDATVGHPHLEPIIKL